MSILSPKRVLSPYYVNTPHIPNDLRAKGVMILHYKAREEMNKSVLKTRRFFSIDIYSLSIHFEWPFIIFTQINFLTSVQFALLERFKIKTFLIKTLLKNWRENFVDA